MQFRPSRPVNRPVTIALCLMLACVGVTVAFSQVEGSAEREAGHERSHVRFDRVGGDQVVEAYPAAALGGPPLRCASEAARPARQATSAELLDAALRRPG